MAKDNFHQNKTIWCESTEKDIRIILKDTIIQSGADPDVLLTEGGGGGVQTLVQKRLLKFFVANYFFPHTPSHQSRLHVIIPWPLTVYLNSTRKGCTLGKFSSCAIIVDQLRKQRRPRFSQSVNAGHHWRGKYCFASRGEQIIGGYRKIITFLNIPGIKFSCKM